MRRACQEDPFRNSCDIEHSGPTGEQ